MKTIGDSPANLHEATGLATAGERARTALGPLFSVIENAGAALVVSDPHLPDNPLIFVNAAFVRLTGYSAAEAIGRNCRFLQGPRSDSGVVRSLHEAIAAGKDATADILNVRKDGSLFWNRMAVSVVRRPDGRPDFFIGSLSDVSIEHGRAHVSGASGVWEWDLKADRLYADARFADLFGLEAREAFFGLPLGALFGHVHADDKMRLRIGLSGVVHGAELFAREFRTVVGDRTFWIAARGNLELDEHGRPARLAGTVRDVTERRRVEEQLRIAQTAGGVGTFEYIAGFGTASVSPQFCRLLGLHATDTLSVRAINAVVHADEAPLISISEQATALSPYREFRIRHAESGEERWLARRGELVDGADAGGKRFVGVIYDVTAAKQAEQQLKSFAQTLEQRVEERTRERDRLWSLSRDLFLVADFTGTIRAVNPAWSDVLGYGLVELVGMSTRELIHPDDVDRGLGLGEALQSGKAVRDFDCRLRMRDGRYAWTNWTAVGQGDEIFAIGRDISQRRQLEDELRQSQKMEAVGQLTGGIAHDFNNMLTGIMGSIDIIGRRIKEGRLGDLDRFLASATTSAERAAALTHRLLAFSRRQSLDVGAVDVDGLILSMEDMLRRTLGENIDFVLALDGALAAATTDANQLESAVLNLVINARDAMADRGQLRISTDARTITGDEPLQGGQLALGDYVVLSVTDTGSGMPDAVIAKAFDPFFTTKPIGQGTGLGLSMIYGFMRQTGGMVIIDSAVGRGTTVQLFLPRFAGAPAAARLEPAPSWQAPRARGERVLVVEDDPSVRLLVMEVLHELGYHAQEASDAASALERLQDSQFDLLVTDVGLPGMDGRSLAGLAAKAHPGLKVLFMTAYAEKAAIRSEFLAANMSMITKPFTMDALAQTIRNIIATEAAT